MFVVDRCQDFGGNFVGFEKVVEVGFSIVFTTLAVTVFHEWSEVVGVFSVFDVNATVVGVE